MRWAIRWWRMAASNWRAELLARGGERLLLPVDVVVADAFTADAASRTVGVDGIEPGWRALDIGPQTVALCTPAQWPTRAR